MSLVFWLILGGLVSLLVVHAAHQASRGGRREPLVSPSLFGNRQMTGGLVMFFFQYMVMMGIFFVIPLYLSVALGLSAIETGHQDHAAVDHDAARRRRAYPGSSRQPRPGGSSRPVSWR